MDPGGSSLRKLIISEYSAVTGAGPVVVTCHIGPQHLPPGVIAVPLKVRARIGIDELKIM